MDYLPQLLAIQKQVNALIAEIQKGIATPSSKGTEIPGAPKKRGRPSKKDMEATKIAAAEAADAILAAGTPEGPKKRGPQTPEAKAAAVAKRKATMERKKAEKAAEAAAMDRATEADAKEEASESEDEAPKSSTSSVASAKPKVKLIAKKAPAPAPELPVPEALVAESDEEEKNRIVYRYMFQLQEAGVNMMESASWLKKGFGLTKIDAEDYVLSYISNYDSLRAKYCEELSSSH
jgi:hypothetical protein